MVIKVVVNMRTSRHALNKLYREREREWYTAHYEPQQPRDPQVVALEDADIKRRREAFGIY